MGEALSRIPRLGLVGLGRWGRILARNITDRPDMILAAVATSSAPQDLPAQCAVVSHWRHLLSMDLDGLVIAAPPAAHAEICLEAMAVGMGLFVEKPLTLEGAQARSLAQAAIRHDSLIMVDHIHLYSPAFCQLKALAGKLGPIQAVTSEAGNHGPYRDDASVLWDWGPHDVSMMIDLFGRSPDQISAARRERCAKGKAFAETIALELQFGEIICHTLISTLTDKVRRFTVICRDGTLVYDDLAADKLTLDAMAVPIDKRTPLQVALESFAEALRIGKRDRHGLMLGVSVVETLEAAQSKL